MSYSSEITSPQKCFLRVSCFHYVLNPHGIIFSFSKSWAVKKIIIKTGVSQWDSPTFVWFLLKEHYNMHGLFEQSGEMPVFCTQLGEPRDMRVWQGKMWILSMHIRPFYSVLCLHWQRFSLSLSHHSVFWLVLPGKCCLTMSTPAPHTRGFSPSAALVQCNFQQMTSRASVSPAVMNANENPEHKNNAAVPKSL